MLPLVKRKVGMARRIMTLKRFEEIQRLIAAGKSDRIISRALGCRRSKVSRIRCPLNGD